MAQEDLAVAKMHNNQPGDADALRPRCQMFQFSSAIDDSLKQSPRSITLMLVTPKINRNPCAFSNLGAGDK